MGITEFCETYKGRINEVVIGSGDKCIKIGGEKTLPLHGFEGEEGHSVAFALEIWDLPPTDWKDILLSPYKDVIDDPILWAKKAISYGADLLALYLRSIEDSDFDPERIIKNIKSIADFSPLLVMGVGDKDKDTKVLIEVANRCSGMNLLIGPLVKENCEEIAMAAHSSGHNIIVQTPVNVNLAKELNVKLTKFFPKEKIVIDSLSAALGYGLESSFSIMERIKQIGVVHDDEMVQMPIIANLGREVWKQKEVSEDKTQGILWEALTALTLISAGANIVVMRHPESLSLVKETFSQNKS